MPGLLPVGESAHADPDSLEHAVASQLVHDQWWLHLVRRMVVMITMVIMMITMVIMMMMMMIRGGSTSPGFLWVLGTRQRTKWGSQLCRVAISSPRETR